MVSLVQPPTGVLATAERSAREALLAYPWPADLMPDIALVAAELETNVAADEARPMRPTSMHTTPSSGL